MRSRLITALSLSLTATGIGWMVWLALLAMAQRGAGL